MFENVFRIGLSSNTKIFELIQHAYLMIDYSSAEALNVPHLVQSMLQLKDSWACHILKEALEEDLPEFISQLISRYEEVEEEDDLQTSPQEKSEPWRNFVTCLNDCLQDHNPLIGREAELERTIQVLCRKEKNNPLHVGEPGVGKTSLAYGLAARIEAREVPERLLDCRIYELDLHGYLGADLMRKEGFPRHALVCERHTGAGMSLQSIIDQQLPVPHRNMVPVSLEEQVICFADKFFSKTHLDREKSVEKALKSISRYGEA